MKRGSIILFFMLSISIVEAQDPHFSQFDNVCFHTNPAKSGFFASNFRFSANTKIQWNSVSEPYQTYLAGFDMALLKRPTHYDIFGIGIDFISDKAGTSNFRTSGAGLSIAYIKSLNNFNNHFLSIGFGISAFQRSFDIDNLTFDSQYNGSFFDPLLPINETIDDFIFWYPTVSIGTYYFREVNHKHCLSLGFSAQNLNRPLQSHFSNNNVRLNTKWNAEISYSIPLKNNNSIIPKAFLSIQGNYKEFVMGSSFKTEIDNKKFSASLLWRTSDALIFIGQVELRNFLLGISYDMNISGLVPASHLQGGFEFGTILKINNPARQKSKVIPCPIF